MTSGIDAHRGSRDRPFKKYGCGAGGSFLAMGCEKQVPSGGVGGTDGRSCTEDSARDESTVP
jgi:hypothetical protein